ncbi:hypothetical protein T02_10542 [Trichinella nativa]|uniref:Uncharacterized protein n=1 Tax=Trichinella nativa TaxID=6335 RepID=A0A0V1KS68_9BILA|nr:hypothetical protein T02_10542 [Trichinella nativa]
MNINNEKTTHLANRSLLAYYSVHVIKRCRLEFILSEKFQCTKTGFQRCAMQITITIKGALSSVKLMKQRKSENADATKKNNRKQETCGGCISTVHIVSRHRLEFILSKRFQCTKTGFQRCAMQITITIKGALSSVRAHSCKVKKSENADDTKQITDRTKQNKRRQKLPKIVISRCRKDIFRCKTVLFVFHIMSRLVVFIG